MAVQTKTRQKKKKNAHRHTQSGLITEGSELSADLTEAPLASAGMQTSAKGGGGGAGRGRAEVGVGSGGAGLLFITFS